MTITFVVSNKAFDTVRRKLKVFSKYKDKNHPAVKNANAKAKTELKKARRSVEKKLARNIKEDRKSFLHMLEANPRPGFR